MVRRPGRASRAPIEWWTVQSCDFGALFPSGAADGPGIVENPQEQFKVIDMLVVMQHQESMIQKVQVIAGVAQVQTIDRW